MSVDRRIPTYFSHSYRREDRDVNEYFWRAFEAQGFGFTVDPRSGPPSTCHLEMTMRRSACFVAVVPLRRGQPGYKCSPFTVYEHGLAVLARKPRLVFAERGVPAHLFPDFVERHVFDREELDTYHGFAEPIRRLALQAQGYSTVGDRLLGEAGLVLPDTRAYQEVRPLVVRTLERFGYAVRDVSLDLRNPGTLPHQLERFDFVVVDVRTPDLPPNLYPLLFGLFVPRLNLAHHDDPDQPGENLPDLVVGEPLRHATESQEPVLWWHDPAALIGGLERQLERFALPRQQFRTLAEGVGYIRSTGRADGKIFLSTAGADTELSSQVGRALKLQNFDFFHYLHNNTIPRGSDWQERLDQELAASQVFVPLVSASYWRSEWCRRELMTARRLSEQGQLSIIPYFLDTSAGETFTEQGVDMTDFSADDRVAQIVRDLDGWFTSARS
ncbi:toll/interleukin-1 receptor domain-containing protein [Streptomyces chartreusis]|uniref:toll/interleukin-1 receptor domain-containing protein n=1 Tax=Streptomyces chartreusis TaxID=1969 RepID=UPI0036AD0AD2